GGRRRLDAGARRAGGRPRHRRHVPPSRQRRQQSQLPLSARRPPARPVTVLKASAPIPAPSWHLKLIARRNAPSPTPGASGHARRHPPTSPPVGTPGSADPPEWLVATPPAQHEPRGPESPLSAALPLQSRP